MNKQNNKIELKENYLVTNALNTIKYVLGNDLSSKLNTALQDYIDDITRLSIDYSDIEDDLIRSQLENFNQMMIMAKAKNDFAEFCRCAGLKIESVLEYFIEKHQPNKTEDESYENYQSRYSGKYKKYDYWYKIYFKIDEPWYKFYYIYNLLKIRDAASHRNLYADTMYENIRRIHSKNRNIEKIIDFYNNENFTLVKNRTEWFVKTTLLHIESL